MNYQPIAKINQILNAYNLGQAGWEIHPFGTGLINFTWLLSGKNNDYILQKFNNEVFKYPGFIAQNIKILGEYLQDKKPDYLFVKPELTNSGEQLLFIEDDGYYRLFKFVNGSHSINKAEKESLAFGASKKFGEFTRVLSGFPVEQLKITIPDFHDLTLRYDQFQKALKNGNRSRAFVAKRAIEFIRGNSQIVEIYQAIKGSRDFKLRVTHHDTKISNVLFDGADNGLCVIDLDTVMPGYFISDVGDMIRTYISPSNEEEKDLSKISIRDEYFVALWNGYISEMNEELTQKEKEHFIYAGKFMIYMQAMRFLTDYLNDDVYYGSTYPDQNFFRASNQIRLFECLVEKEDHLKKLIGLKSL